MGLSRRFHHIYNDKDIPYDACGTIGKYCEFSEGVLLGGADLAQKWSNRSFEHGDTECDKNSIKIGFSIYDEYIKGTSISAGNILIHIDSNDFFKPSYYKGECKDDESKK